MSTPHLATAHQSAALSDTRNIVLTGFMGTGKSTVGRLLAKTVGRPFVDMDAHLEEAFGKSISELFAQEGEPAFRVAEATLCAQLADESGLVISTGGGALINPRSRAALAETGILVCLTATPDTILQRLAEETHRPLLSGSPADQRRKVSDILHERRHVYASIPQQVATDGLAPEAVVARILNAVAAEAEAPGMTRIPVAGPSANYDLLVGAGLLAQAGDLLRRRGVQPGTMAVVSNEVIAQSHWPALQKSLESTGFAPSLCLVPEGEQHKTLATAASLYDHFAAIKLDRTGAVLALGGGVIGDLAGFAAATWLRGVTFVQAPTSLLAMVDASVGGKTGVDLTQGKNLVGAFKQPAAVIMDTATFATLPAAEFRSGLAEVVKHGIIGAPALFEALEVYGPTNLERLVIDAVRVKVAVVEEDPFEQGKRALLNLGHTFGHGIEQASAYGLRHGEAVAVGICAAAFMAQSIGLCDDGLPARIAALLERLGLPTSVSGLEREAVFAAMGMDKKRAGKTLRFVLPINVGECRLVDSPGDDVVYAALDSVLKTAPQSGKAG